MTEKRKNKKILFLFKQYGVGIQQYPTNPQAFASFYNRLTDMIVEDMMKVDTDGCFPFAPGGACKRPSVFENSSMRNILDIIMKHHDSPPPVQSTNPQ